MQIEENDLEKAFRIAAGEPAKRPDFYKALLEATVFIIGESGPSVGQKTIEAGEEIKIQNWVRQDNTPVIPFFTSLRSLQRAIDTECNYLSLPARRLFEITKGSKLFLNPKSEHRKEFFPNEIEALLSHGVNRLPEQRVTSKATQVLLGQPAVYPAKMVESLSTLFATRGNVKAAYLVQMHDPQHDKKPHLVIGIAADGDIETIVREAGAVAGDTSPAGERVDLVRIAHDEQGLSEYFLKQVRPFYERRSWGAKLTAFFGAGRT